MAATRREFMKAIAAVAVLPMLPAAVAESDLIETVFELMEERCRELGLTVISGKRRYVLSRDWHWEPVPDVHCFSVRTVERGKLSLRMPDVPEDARPMYWPHTAKKTLGRIAA